MLPAELSPSAPHRSHFSSVPSLEKLALDRYLVYLEAECAAYVGLTQAPSLLLRGDSSCIRNRGEEVLHAVFLQDWQSGCFSSSSPNCRPVCLAWPAQHSGRRCWPGCWGKTFRQRGTVSGLRCRRFALNFWGDPSNIFALNWLYVLSQGGSGWRLHPSPRSSPAPGAPSPDPAAAVAGCHLYLALLLWHLHTGDNGGGAAQC